MKTEEIIEVLDNKGTPIGRMFKSAVHQHSLWHHSINVWIYNSKGELLLQKRARTKRWYPNKWCESASGHVAYHEDIIHAAQRELYEEMGLKIPRSLFKEAFVYKETIPLKKNSNNNELVHLFFIRYDKSLTTLKFRDKEVEDAQFININELQKLLKNKRIYTQFVPHGKRYKQIISYTQKLLTQDK